MTNVEPVQWSDGYELESAARAAWIEHELQIRGDGCWRPWSALEPQKRAHWERIATAVIRAMNYARLEDS